MAELLNPNVDFSSLGQLPAVYQKAQQDQLRQQTLANLGQGGAVDANTLLRSGDLSLAQLGVGLQNRSADDAWRREEAGRAQKNADRSYGLQVRTANRADDPTPDGFAKGPDGTYAPLPGGPQDPSYHARVAAETARAKGDLPTIMGAGSSVIIPNKAADGPLYRNQVAAPSENALLDDDVARSMAQQFLTSGDQSIFQNLGRGSQGAQNVIKLRKMIDDERKMQGLSPADISQRKIDYIGDTSRERTAATQEGRMSSAGIEAQGAINLGRQASDLVPRTKWVPVNRAIQAYQANTSDPHLKAFGASNLTIINTYARAINPNGVGTVSDKEHAAEMLKMADGPEAYNAVLDQLTKEIEMAHQSPAKARAGFKSERAARMGASAPAPPKVGELRDGYRYKSGDPADQASWVKVN